MADPYGNVKLGRSTSDGGCVPAPTPELFRAIDEVQTLQSMAKEVVSNLDGFIGKVIGSDDESCETACDSPAFGRGALGDLRRSIYSTSETLLGILEMTRTLRTIA